MSTPRTDAELEDARNVALEFETRLHPKPEDGPPLVVAANFARQLERELEEAKAQLPARYRYSENGLLASSVKLLVEDYEDAEREVERTQDRVVAINAQLTDHKAALARCEVALHRSSGEIPSTATQVNESRQEALTAINELKTPCEP